MRKPEQKVETGLSMKQLRAMRPEEPLSPSQPTCSAERSTRLHDNTTGTRITTDGIDCSDCFFEALGDEIDGHPTGAPHRRNGAASG
jgi:hypothetical protein